MATRGTTRDWQWLKGADFREVDHDRTAVYVTFSPLEVHGPHLPVAADNFEAESLAEHTFDRLLERHPELGILRLPPLFIATDVLPRTGSLSFRPSTIVRVLEDLARTLSKQGFRHLWVGNFHGGPRHWIAIEKACARANRRYGMQAVGLFSMLINRLTQGSLRMTDVLGDIEGLSADLLDGDAHAGVIETSLLLHLVPDQVATDFADLPTRTLKQQLAEQGKQAPASGDRTGLIEVLRWLSLSLKFYERETYQGSPARATAEIGAQLLDRFAELSADALSDLWTGKLSPKDAHTPLYKLRFILLNEQLRWVFEKLVGFKSEVS